MENLRTFEKHAFQGDVYFRKLDKMPEGNFVEQAPEDGVHVVAHSETGHNHVMEARDVTYFNDPDDAFKSLMVVKNATPLVHNRSFDTHDPILFNPGIYSVNRQREYMPEGFRKVQD